MFMAMKHLLLLNAMLLAAACVDNGSLPDIPAEFDEGPPLVSSDGKTDGLGQAIPAYAELRVDQSLEVEFEAMFAPDDPVNTVERGMIQRVVDERLNDARDFREGENPYRIRYAVYNLRNPLIVDALADAEEAGVDVQVLIDAAQLDPARTWNVADEVLIERGFEFEPDHRNLSGERLVTADLVGIEGSGLMHLKMRLYETPSRRAILSGSLNPGDKAVLNEETLHLIRDPAIVERYAKAYDVVLSDGDFTNEWDDDAAINVLFTPASSERAAGHVFDWLADEDEQILLMVFSLRDITAPGHSRSLVELLADKVDEGVDVWVITDRKQSDGVDANGDPYARNDNTDDRLRSAGVHVYEATNLANEFTAMHHKAAVLGRSNIRVITDAANWTFSGLGSSTRRARNIESQLFIDSAGLDDNRTGRRYMAQWVRVGARYAHQSAADHEPDFEQLWETLSTTDSWPAQPVSFTADNADTAFGQSVFVLGNLTDLGQWGTESQGVELSTDEATYPTWTTPDPPSLLLGQPFEFKFTIAFPGDPQTSWEQGDNRIGFAQPTALGEGPDANHRGVFR